MKSEKWLLPLPEAPSEGQLSQMIIINITLVSRLRALLQILPRSDPHRDFFMSEENIGDNDDKVKTKDSSGINENHEYRFKINLKDI